MKYRLGRILPAIAAQDLTTDPTATLNQLLARLTEAPVDASTLTEKMQLFFPPIKLEKPTAAALKRGGALSRSLTKLKNQSTDIHELSATEQYHQSFLLTYETFCHSDTIVEQLCQRYALGDDRVKLRILHFFTRWMSNFPKDWRPQHVERVWETLAGRPAPPMDKEIPLTPQELVYAYHRQVASLMRQLSLRQYETQLLTYKHCFTGADLLTHVFEVGQRLPFIGMTAVEFAEMLVDCCIIRRVDGDGDSGEFSNTPTAMYQFHPHLLAVDFPHHEFITLSKPAFEELFEPLPTAHLTSRSNPNLLSEHSYPLTLFLHFTRPRNYHKLVALLYEMEVLTKCTDQAHRPRLGMRFYETILASLDVQEFVEMLPGGGIHSGAVRGLLVESTPGKHFQQLRKVISEFIKNVLVPSFLGSEEHSKLVGNPHRSLAEWIRVQPRVVFNNMSMGDVSDEKDLLWSFTDTSIFKKVENVYARAGMPVPKVPRSMTDVIKFHPHKTRDLSSGRVVLGTVFSDLDELEIARQLTILNHSLFLNIERAELLGQKWNRPDTHNQAPNLMRFINRFNSESNFTCTLILEQHDLKERARMMERFIRIAHACMELRNYSSMMAIYAALNSAPVMRLKLTRSAMPRAAQQLEQEIGAFISHESNYKVYREACTKSRQPTVPYLGVFLADLTFIDEGNRKRINGRINFTQRLQLADVIAPLLAMQQRHYQLAKVDPVYNMLAGALPAQADDNLYALSLINEPRAVTAAPVNS